jgi:hypothetical protein
MYFVDPAYKMYEYSVRMAPGGLTHVGVYGMDKVVLMYTVHSSDFHAKQCRQCTDIDKIKFIDI